MSPELTEAINTATVPRLRKVMIQTCEDNLIVRHVISEALLLPTKDNEIGELDITESRKRKRYEVCKQCSHEYETNKNEEGVCVHHSGSKEIDCDQEMWDHPTMSGEPEDHLDDPNFQQGIIWSCCQGEGDAAGCKRSKHQPKIDQAHPKRRAS